jgi:hypothetical protein
MPQISKYIFAAVNNLKGLSGIVNQGYKTSVFNFN